MLSSSLEMVFMFFLPICFCRLIHRNMNCACSRSINTSSKVTDPSVDATWLRLQSMQHLDTSGICMQSPSITDFMDENGAFRSNRFPYSWCYRFKTWDVWWLLQKNLPNLTLFVTPSFASAFFEHFSATVHAMILTSEPSPMAFRSLWDRPETNPSNLMILMSSFHYETFIVWYIHLLLRLMSLEPMEEPGHFLVTTRRVST